MVSRPQPAGTEFGGVHSSGLKGFLVWHDQPFLKTHDLGKLGKQAVELDQTLEPLIDEVVEFTKYAWLFRYPGDVEEPSVGEAVVEASPSAGPDPSLLRVPHDLCGRA